MNEIFSRFYGYSRAIWRRRWWGIAAAWLVALTVWGFVLSVPSRYEASARVFVDARTPLRPVLEGLAGGTAGLESKLALVREALLSRPALEAVAKQAALFSNTRTPEALEARINMLQQEIKISSEVPEAPGSPNTNAIYTISYQHEDPAKALDVVSKLLGNFVDGTYASDRTGAGEVQSFVVTQIADLERRLQDSELKLAEFRKQHLGLIPGERGDYFTRLDQETAGLQTAETNLAVANSRRVELRRQLESARLFIPGTTSAGSGSTGGPSLDITARRLEAEQRLEELQQRFTDKHPEVMATRRTISELREREAKELAELQRGGQGSGSIRSLNVNPVYQQIQSQINQTNVDIAAIQGAVIQHRQEISSLRQMMNRAPMIEQQYAQLTREYTATKQQYDQMVQRREQSRVSDEAANSGIVRFDVLEPPRAAREPVWPKRALLVLGGLLLSVFVGALASFIPHIVAPSYHDTFSLERSLELPVVGSVTAVRTTAQKWAKRIDYVRVVTACVALVGVAIALMLFGNAGARLLQHLAG